SSRRRHTRFSRDWSSDVCSSDLISGNEIGLPLDEERKLPKADFETKRRAAYTRMYQTGAHYVVDSIADLMPCLDDIEARLARGEDRKSVVKGKSVELHSGRDSKR